jgi:hypothetical protein
MPAFQAKAAELARPDDERLVEPTRLGPVIQESQKEARSAAGINRLSRSRNYDCVSSNKRTQSATLTDIRRSSSAELILRLVPIRLVRFVAIEAGLVIGFFLLRNQVTSLRLPFDGRGEIARFGIRCGEGGDIGPVFPVN